jgi:hypothetical protein
MVFRWFWSISARNLRSRLTVAFANSNLLYEFYKTPFCRMRFLEHEERSDECYKANKCDKTSSKHNVRKIIFAKYKSW